MKRRPLKIVVLSGAAMLLAACGLDVYIYLYPINQYDNTPSEDDARNYISFPTRDADNADNVYFKGFELLYRIYNNTTDLSSDISAISTYNSNNPALVYSYLLSTKSYVRMNAYTRVGNFPLIPGSTSNRIVTVRLVDYETYAAGITVGVDSYGLALRTIDSNTKKDDKSYTFDFDEIGNVDSDVKYNSTWDDSSSKKWYVQVYALAYGYDESFKAIYSEAYSLGHITIKDE